jgi:hypothetical protein
MLTSSNAACRHEGSQSCRQALSKQAVKQTGGLAVRRLGSPAGRQADRQTGNMLTGRQEDGADRQTGRHTNRQTGI